MAAGRTGRRVATLSTERAATRLWKLAAHRAGLADVIIPKRSEPDLDDLPESVRSQLRVHPVADVAEVLKLALEPAPVSAA